MGQLFRAMGDGDSRTILALTWRPRNRVGSKLLRHICGMVELACSFHGPVAMRA